MEKESTKKMTREDALRRLEEARKLKREYVKELEKKRISRNVQGRKLPILKYGRS